LAPLYDVYLARIAAFERMPPASAVEQRAVRPAIAP